WCLTFAGSLELTHMFGRIVTLCHWVICALGTGWVASRLVEQHRFATGAFATLLSFNLLWQMIAEPSHPGSMIAALLAISAVVSVKLVLTDKTQTLAAALGLTGAILIFTKVNVGAFYIAGIGAFALCHTAWPKAWRKPADYIALMGLSLLPWLLMAGNLNDPAMFGFALKASLAGAGVWWIMPRPDLDSRVSPKTWAYCVGWCAIGSAAIIGFILMRGTSLAELFAAVFIDPIQQPGHFTVSPSNTDHSAIAAAISFMIVAAAGWSFRRTGQFSPTVLNVAMTARLALVLGFVWFATRWPAPWGVFTYLDYILPLLPLWLVQPRERKSSISSLLALLTFVSVTQILHAYPVAGSQIGWGCFLSIPIIARGIQRDLSSLSARGPRWLSPAIASGVLFATGAGTITLAQTGWHRYHISRPLPFAGADDIRLDDRTRIALTAVVQNAMVRSDVLFTRQGMYSLNIWSQVPTPTARNATHWFWLLDESEQADIIDRLGSTHRSTVIVNEPLDAFLEEIEVEVAGPLQDYIEENYQSVLKIRGFDIRVPPGSKTALIGSAFLLHDDTTSSSHETTPDTPWNVWFNVVLQGTPTSVEIVEFDGAGNAHPCLLGLTDIQFAPIRSDGDVMFEKQPLESANRLEGLFNFTARSNRPASAWNYRNKGIVIKDAQGAVLAEVLIE
ncbi:MAG: hypothetical protein HOH58_11025, partial [Opitutaceae bacterium]|nr:hypothetical protein [Opitutaceae bacterium]